MLEQKTTSMDRFLNKKIILASNSPRRHQFLRDIGIHFEVKTHAVEEVYPPHLMGAEIPNYLAKLKATPFKNLQPDEVVITSDTIVWSNHQCLGKPTDIPEAKSMLEQLSGSSHEVITAVGFTLANAQHLIHEVSTVYFKPLTEEEIEFYIDHFKPFDKAGAYGIQEWIGTIGIEKIEGSYTNIVGLPVAQVLATLEKICNE